MTVINVIVIFAFLSANLWLGDWISRTFEVSILLAWPLALAIGIGVWAVFACLANIPERRAKRAHQQADLHPDALADGEGIKVDADQ